jgi:tetratricopeptide (TPR) repeat protein
LKLYEKAIDSYQHALVLDEKFAYAYRNMGDAYLRLHKYKEAIESLEKVLELALPEDVIYEAIGHCYHKLGHTAHPRFHYKKAVHLNAEDSKLHFKIATTYMQEGQWNNAIRYLENALRLQRNVAEYNLAMGECKLHLQHYKEALFYFGFVVIHKPKKVAGWEALIRCLYLAGYYEEAATHCLLALKATDEKPIFIFNQSAISFALNKSKEGLIYL